MRLYVVPAFTDHARSTHYYRLLNFNIPDYGRFRPAFALHELPSLIEVIFSSKDEGDTICRLLGDDAQAFVDVIDEARSTSAYHHEPVLVGANTHTFRQPGAR